MPIFISRRQVLNNLHRFKGALSSASEGYEQDRRIYKAMLDFQTGDMQFSFTPDLMTKASHWLDFEVEAGWTHRSSGFFAAKNLNHQPLDPKQMAPMAWRVMSETLQALNEIIAQHDSSQLVIEKIAVRGIDEDVCSFKAIEALPGWVGRLDRFKAEEWLLSQPIGTYILRNGDGFTEVIAEKLMESNQVGVELFICTVVDPEDKICDLMLLMNDRGWAFYRDNPDLSDAEYIFCESPQQLLSQLGERLKGPLS